MIRRSLDQLDQEVVHKTDDETIAGVKTFTDGLKLQGQNVSPFSGFKNYIINGNFDVCQRNTSGVSTSSPYTADMWKVWASGANTNWSRASSADFDSYSKFVGCGLKWNGGSASVTAPIEHRIESINAYKLSGKKVTLSFLAKCSVNASVNVVIGIPNGIDNFSATTGILSQTVNLTTTTQKFSVTFDLTNADVRNGLTLIIYPSIPSAFHWIAQVQLEEGSVATPFEQRPYGLELALCQRYFERRRLAVFAPAAATSTNFGGSVPVNIMNTFRVSPSFSVNSVLFSSNWVGSLTLSWMTFGGTVFSSVQQTTVGAFIDAICDFSAEL